MSSHSEKTPAARRPKEAPPPPLGAATPRKRRVRMRDLCLLDRLEDRPIEPLGFVGWEVMIEPSLAADISPWIPDDSGGRVLFVAQAEHLQAKESFLTPQRTTPLLLWLTHRSLRGLYLCTPSEALVLGERLKMLGAYAVGAATVEECAPAVVADLLQRWLDEDPEGNSLRAAFPAVGRVKEAVRMVPWACCWPEDLLRALPRRDEMHPSGQFLPPLQEDWQPAKVMTYRDDPIVLVPVRVGLGRHCRLDRILEVLGGEDEYVREPLASSLHRGIATVAGWRCAVAMAPVMKSDWREKMALLRNRVGERLRTQTAVIPTEHRHVAALVRGLTRGRRALLGINEIYQPPVPGARRQLPSSQRTREIRRRLVNALGLSLGDRCLAPTPSERDPDDSSYLVH